MKMKMLVFSTLVVGAMAATGCSQKTTNSAYRMSNNARAVAPRTTTMPRTTTIPNMTNNIITPNATDYNYHYNLRGANYNETDFYTNTDGTIDMTARQPYTNNTNDSITDFERYNANMTGDYYNNRLTTKANVQTNKRNIVDNSNPNNSITAKKAKENNLALRNNTNRAMNSLTNNVNKTVKNINTPSPLPTTTPMTIINPKVNQVITDTEWE